MRFYRIHIWDERDGSRGFTWVGSKRAAQAARAKYIREGFDREQTTIEPVDIDTNKAGILRALNAYADYPDNG